MKIKIIEKLFTQTVKRQNQNVNTPQNKCAQTDGIVAEGLCV